MNGLKFSKFNVFFENEQKRYIYNTLSTAVAELNETAYTVARSGEVGQLNPEYIEAMLQQHFLVDNGVNEVEEYLYFYNSYRFGRSAGALSITIVPTYNCNLACTYCMQGQSKSNQRITTQDTGRILAFVESQIASSRRNGVPITKIHAGLYGGEPMLHKNALTQFSDGIKGIADRFDCEINFSMTSNLTLLDEEMIALIRDNHVSVQVSIDGSRPNHDSRRINRDGTGTYDTILRSLQELNEAGLKKLVVIRVNIDRDNIIDAEKVLQDIHQYSDDVYFGFLDTFSGLNDSFADNCISRESYSELVTKKFDELAKRYGYPTPARFGKQSPCTLNSLNKYFIDSRLDVYKCEMFLNRPEVRVGTISPTGKFIPEAGFYHQMNRNPGQFPECLECKLLPMCAGGCAGKKYVTSNSKDGRLLERNCMYTESSLLDYLKDYVRTKVPQRSTGNLV